MSLWYKLNTLFKASAQEPLHQLVDANGIRIFEQQLRDSDQAVVLAKRELACVIAEKKRLQRHNELLSQAIATRSEQAKQALDKSEQALAEELAGIIAEDENLLQEQDQQLASLLNQERRLKRQLKQTSQQLLRYHNELRLAKANRSAQSVMKHLNGHAMGLSSQVGEMEQTLDQIKGRQQRSVDFDRAFSEVEAECGEGDLDNKLAKAGIRTEGPNAQTVLERLRNEVGGQNQQSNTPK